MYYVGELVAIEISGFKSENTELKKESENKSRVIEEKTKESDQISRRLKKSELEVKELKKYLAEKEKELDKFKEEVEEKDSLIKKLTNLLNLEKKTLLSLPKKSSKFKVFKANFNKLIIKKEKVQKQEMVAKILVVETRK